MYAYKFKHDFLFHLQLKKLPLKKVAFNDQVFIPEK